MDKTKIHTTATGLEGETDTHISYLSLHFGQHFSKSMVFTNWGDPHLLL